MVPTLETDDYKGYVYLKNNGKTPMAGENLHTLQEFQLLCFLPDRVEPTPDVSSEVQELIKSSLTSHQ